MRWSIIRLIWLRELKDQMRDRRTLLMVAGLPLLLYPILGVAVLKFAVGFAEKPAIIGIVSGPGRPEEFPPRRQPSPVPTMSWLALTPGAPGPGGFLDKAVAAASLAEASRAANETTGISAVPALTWLAVGAPAPGHGGIDQLAGAASLAAYSHMSVDFPQLAANGAFVTLYLQQPADKLLVPFSASKFRIEWLDRPRRDWLQSKRIDVLLSASPAFWSSIERGQPTVALEWRHHDDTSELAAQRLSYVLARWKKHIKEIRFVHNKLPSHFDDPFVVREQDDDPATGGSRNILEMLVRIFPFMLVMWSLAGALYPAVDLCAGEKERGTMETLLITPASREEIVLGKFLTIWVFSAATAVLNIVSMGLTTWAIAGQLPKVEFTAWGMLWCLLLLLPLSAFFSAICLAIGAYARSSKEGQYYLMPLFLITMPLIFLTLAPGVELNPFYSMVPVTGVALLMQRFLTAASMDRPWFYLGAVMAPIALYSWLALRWAIDQFQREEVLFREAERLDLRLWVRRLFRDKEARPTTGQAMFCFGVLLGLRWLSEGLGQEVGVLARSSIIAAAFLAAPPIFMAVLLTTRPRQVLATHWPAWPFVAAAVLLVPLVEAAVTLSDHVSPLSQFVNDRRTLVQETFAGQGSRSLATTISILAAALLAAAAQEIAFRGFIFAGLLKRMQPWPAVLVSSFLFAAFHMNVFLMPPLFLLGIALGMLAVRSGSLLPGFILHGSCNVLLLLGESTWGTAADYTITAACTAAAAALLWWQNRRAGAGPLASVVALPKPMPSPNRESESGQPAVAISPLRK